MRRGALAMVGGSLLAAAPGCSNRGGVADCSYYQPVAELHGVVDPSTQVSFTQGDKETDMGASCSAVVRGTATITSAPLATVPLVFAIDVTCADVSFNVPIPDVRTVDTGIYAPTNAWGAYYRYAPGGDCYWDPTMVSASLTLDDVTGGAAPFPKVVTDDFTRRLTLVVQIASMKGSRGGEAGVCPSTAVSAQVIVDVTSAGLVTKTNEVCAL